MNTNRHQHPTETTTMTTSNTNTDTNTTTMTDYDNDTVARVIRRLSKLDSAESTVVSLSMAKRDLELLIETLRSRQV